MKLLSIGNSFSQDAQRYFGRICRAGGKELTRNTNLYIGGCSLEMHLNNIESGAPEYIRQEGGVSDGDRASLTETLLSDEWDVVTLQEVSGRSFNEEYFRRDLPRLADFVRKNKPNAKIALHMTWGYESGSERIRNLGLENMGDMFARIESTYAMAMELIGADILIPSGKVIQRLSDEGYTVHRDTFHLSLGLGRYAAALTWAKTLFGLSPFSDTFSNFDEEIAPDALIAARRAVDELV